MLIASFCSTDSVRGCEPPDTIGEGGAALCYKGPAEVLIQNVIDDSSLSLVILQPDEKRGDPLRLNQWSEILYSFTHYIPRQHSECVSIPSSFYISITSCSLFLIYSFLFFHFFRSFFFLFSFFIILRTLRAADAAAASGTPLPPFIRNGSLYTRRQLRTI